MTFNHLLSSRTPIKKEKHFLNLGCSHANSYDLPIETSYPYLLAEKLNLGYLDLSHARTSLEYSDFCLNTVDYSKCAFVLWQLTYPWRKHDFTATNRQDARLDNYKDMTLHESFSRFANIINKYKDENIYFVFMHQPYVKKYLKQLVSMNSKVFPYNIDFIDEGSNKENLGKDHGGLESQKLIANLLFDFIKNNDS